MNKLENVLKVAKEYKAKYEITDESSEAEKLRYELMQRNMSKEDILKLQQKVIVFPNSDASE